MCLDVARTEAMPDGKKKKNPNEETQAVQSEKLQRWKANIVE